MILKTNAADSEFNPVTKSRNAIGFSTQYFFESDAVTNRFALAYFKNEFIDSGKKDIVSGKLSTTNRFGAGFTNNLNYSRYNDTLFSLPHSFYSISLRDIYHLSSKFPRDVFELYFRGNKSYAGEKAVLGDFKFNQLLYRQVNFTLGHENYVENGSWGFTSGISLNLGRKFFTIHAPKAFLYTDSKGEYLDLEADIDIHRSDSSKEGFSAINGLGASVDISFFWKNKRNDKLYLSVSNVGFIRWNEKSSFTHADTSFRFNGIDVSDIFLLTDSIREPISLDSSLVEPYLTDRVKKSHTSKTPALLIVQYRYTLKPEKLDLEAGIGYLLFAYSRPFGTLELTYKNPDYVRVGIKASYGGYSGLRAGISGSVLLTKHFLLSIQCDPLSNMLYSKGNAQGAFVSLTAYF